MKIIFMLVLIQDQEENITIIDLEIQIFQVNMIFVYVVSSSKEIRRRNPSP